MPMHQDPLLVSTGFRHTCIWLIKWMWSKSRVEACVLNLQPAQHIVLVNKPDIALISVTEISRHWSIWWFASVVPIHHPNLLWAIMKWNLSSKRQRNLNRNMNISIQETVLEYVVCTMVAILSRPQYVDRRPKVKTQNQWGPSALLTASRCTLHGKVLSIPVYQHERKNRHGDNIPSYDYERKQFIFLFTLGSS